MTFEQNGKIPNFGNFTPAQLQQLIWDLSLHITPAQIQFCSSYYRNAEKGRAPFFAEIKLLESLLALSPDPREVTLSELYTNDDYVAATYADMMNKRRELYPNAKTPISLGEALGMATAYLFRAGKRSELPMTDLVPTMTEPEAADASCIMAKGAHSAIRLSKKQPNPVFVPGDLFLLIHRGEMPMWRFRAEIAPFLASPSMADRAKLSLTVPKSGLLPLLLPLCPDVCYRLAALTPAGRPISPEPLFHHYADYRVVLVSREHAKSFAADVEAAGFRVNVFASVINGERTEFLYPEKERSFSLETRFLRRLTLSAPMVAKLPNEPQQPDSISIEPLSAKSCSYLVSSTCPQRLKMADCTVTVAQVKMHDAFFRSALHATVSAVLSLAAGGADYAKARLAVCLEIPPIENDPQMLGKVMASILGVYRAQCELGIPAPIRSIKTVSELEEPTLCVYGLTSQRSIPSQLAKAGSTVSCVIPPMMEDAALSFDELRRFLNEMNRQHAEGKLQSARVICRQTITEAVATQSVHGLTCQFHDGFIENGNALPFALLLESSEPLPYTAIGSVIPVEIPEAEQIDLPSPQKALNRGDHCEITVLASSTDTDALSLAAFLRDNGASCRVLSEAVEASTLTRSVLHSQLLILCNGITLPDTDETHFALQTLAAAGGSVLTFGDCSLPSIGRIQAFSESVREEILLRLLEKED